MLKILIPILVAISVISAAIAVAITTNMYQCHSEWSESGFEVRYKMFAGCQIKKDGKWFPASALRIDK